jgi:hypothetical protein
MHPPTKKEKGSIKGLYEKNYPVDLNCFYELEGYGYFGAF